ncbi:MAG: glycosyltransferase family 39 protein [Phycisphaerae bacterium]|nr:glycosyltransferase family 39 protein [Phycisphaerae bacterium]
MKWVRIIPVVCLLVVYIAMAVMGMTWGLPTSRVDNLLFGDGPVWEGERIARLTGAAERLCLPSGADVDVDPVQFTGSKPVSLTASEADVAAIYRRYRLYTHQPDEMITMMALAGMRPGELHFDPKLYQYGGLFVYPVGAVIRLGGAMGLIEVTSDLVYYLDHPDEFGKFYIAARVYVAMWGAVGVVLVYAIGSRLGGARAGVLAGLLFTLMPVVVCMSHEAKPHLPGAVLMLAAVWWAMRYADGSRNRHWVGMCVCCGAAFGMVLSALPIFVLVPLAELLRGVSLSGGVIGCMKSKTFWKRVAGGSAVGLLVYLVTNPYVPINAVCNREVLRSNLSNSTAMYEIRRVGDGFARVCELTVEGATLPIVVLGAAGLVLGIHRRRRDMLPLVVPAALVFVQFVLLGAGKPAEYGRFGVFTNTALAIATACVLASLAWRGRRPAAMIAPAILVVLLTGHWGWGYLHTFRQDAGLENTRRQFRGVLESQGMPEAEDGRQVICVLADPAPYCLPPMNFAEIRLLLYPSLDAYLADPRGVLVVPSDKIAALECAGGVLPPAGATGGPPYSPISWANKPMVLYLPPDKGLSKKSVVQASSLHGNR